MIEIKLKLLVLIIVFFSSFLIICTRYTACISDISIFYTDISCYISQFLKDMNIKAMLIRHVVVTLSKLDNKISLK